MDIVKTLPYEEFKYFNKSTIQLFKLAYPHRSKIFTEEYFDWRYEKCFGGSAKFICLFESTKLIGQGVIFQQTLFHNGEKLKVAQLVDLVVHPDHRSFSAVRKIYKASKDQLENSQFDLAFALPNSNSIKLNQRLLKLELALPIHSFLTLFSPFTSIENQYCEIYDRNKEYISSEVLDFLKQPESEIMWNEQSIKNRLNDPHHKFGFVYNKDTLLVVSPRKLRGIRCVVIFAIFRKTNNTISKKEWRQLNNAAAKMFKTPFILFVGHNNLLPKPFGIKVSRWIKSAEKPVQILRLNNDTYFEDFSRLELLDLDIL